MDQQFYTTEIIQEAALKTVTFLRHRILDLCAPVLAGVKPAALISFHQEHRNFNRVWDENRSIYTKQSPLSQLIWFELRKNSRETLVLFYRRSHLTTILTDQPNCLFLKRLGYPTTNLNDTLAHFQSRFQEGCPHEIGIILGIPFWDVAGFIKNQGRNYLFNGYWKVYQHPQEALGTFFRYDQARREARIIYN